MIATEIMQKVMVGTASLLLLVSPAAADVIVLDPGPTGHKTGTVLPNATRLQIPGGTRMMVVLPSGDTRTISGPHDATVETLTRNVPLDAAAWQAKLKELTQPSQSEGRVGGTRGARP
jgi:hypothetical protein